MVGPIGREPRVDQDVSRTGAAAAVVAISRLGIGAWQEGARSSMGERRCRGTSAHERVAGRQPSYECSLRRSAVRGLHRAVPPRGPSGRHGIPCVKFDQESCENLRDDCGGHHFEIRPLRVIGTLSAQSSSSAWLRDATKARTVSSRRASISCCLVSSYASHFHTGSAAAASPTASQDDLARRRHHVSSVPLLSKHETPDMELLRHRTLGVVQCHTPVRSSSPSSVGMSC